MLGEIYLAGALAIFFALSGWSESIFGLSTKTKEKELEFLKRTKLTEEKYKKLKNLIAKSKEVDSGKFLKEIISLLRGTRLFKGGKKIFDRLRENDKNLKKLRKYNSHKYVLFIALFLFLFIGGTVMIIFENSIYAINIIIKSLGISLHNLLIVGLQVVLFVIIMIGFIICSKIKITEKTIQDNLNNLIKMGEN